MRSIRTPAIGLAGEGPVIIYSWLAVRVDISLCLEGLASIGRVVHEGEGRNSLVVKLRETNAGFLEPVDHSLVDPVLS